MSQVIDAPVLRHERADTSSVIDEKHSINDEKGSPRLEDKHAPLDDAGDVFEEVREIDLGDDGKERPIGTSVSICSPRLLLTCRLIARDGPRLCHSSDLARGRSLSAHLDIPHDLPRNWSLLLRCCARTDLRKLLSFISTFS